MNDLYIKAQAPSTGGEWTRPAEWLPIEYLDGTQQKFVGLLAIVPDTTNTIGIICAAVGGFTVDWGDGTVINYPSSSAAAQSHTYDYSTISSPLTAEGFKQVIVTVTAQNTSNPITRFSHSPSNLSIFRPNWLDIEMCLPNLTASFVNYQSTLQTKLARWRFAGTTPSISMGNLLQQMANIEVFEIDWSKPTNLANMLSYGGIRKLGDINITNLSSAGAGLSGARNMKLKEIGNIVTNGNISLGLGGLEKIGNITANGATAIVFIENSNFREVGKISSTTLTSLSQSFRTCIGLRGLVELDCPNLQNISQIFFNATGVEEFKIVNASNITTAANAFDGVRMLRKITLNGMRVGFNITNNMMSETELNNMFTSLGTASGAQTITVTGNPGAATCDTTIATGKGYTVVI